MDHTDAPKTKTTDDKKFLLVGIGASAGGVQALKSLFASIPADSGMAYAVVLHLSQAHESNLDAILQTQTAMPVLQVYKPVTVKPNHVYVIPPGKFLELTDGIIRLTEPERIEGKRIAIDHFFRNLADVYGIRAVCIILSGTGSDGTLGMKQIKERKGFAIAQDPEDAAFGEMPSSAIHTGLIDVVLPIPKMAEKLLAVRDSTERFRLVDKNDQKVAEQIKGSEALREIITLLRVRTGNDFANYKQTTILRRIARHLQIHELESMTDYVHLLRDRPEEVDFLLNNLLINVTNFFRDKDVFEALETSVIPQLFEGKTAQDTLRVWVAGCASGEEAYSMAMLLTEHAAKIPHPPKIQIFASDVDKEAIAEARLGQYNTSIVLDVSEERLQRFFVKEDHTYRVRKELRELILFSPHNLLRDPPFSKLDLVSCRNVLIYLNRPTQVKVLQVFHFALGKSGFLVLGSSETAEGTPNLFTPIEKKLRIYTRTGSESIIYAPPVLPFGNNWQVKIPELPMIQPEKSFSFGELHFRLLEQYAPPSALVNEEFDILHLSEHAGRYLRHVGGEPTSNLLKIIHPDLRPDVRAALFAAQQEAQTVEVPDVRMELDGQERYINLTVHNITAPQSVRGFLLVLFEEHSYARTAPAENGQKQKLISTDDAMEGVVRRLEDDLQRTKDRLRTTVEQYETSLEELKASNEELQAINEELRSTSEELETSKEELQSVNEELISVNQEMKDTLEEISRANADLQNLMVSIHIGTIFLDRTLHIKLFTPEVQKIFNILPADVGRPISDFTNKLDYDFLNEDAQQVLKTLQATEREVCSAEGHWYIARLLPYRTLEDRIDGIVMTFVDITERKKAEEKMRASDKLFRAVVSQTTVGIALTDLTGRFTFVNDHYCQIVGYTAEELLQRKIQDLTHLEDVVSHREKFIQMVKKGESFTGKQRYIRKGGAAVWVSNSVKLVRDEQEKAAYAIVVSVGISELKQSEEDLRESEARYRTLFNSIDEGFCVCEMLFDENNQPVDYRFLEVNLMYEKLTGLKNAVGKTGRELEPNLEKHWFEIYGKVVLTGEPIRFESHLAAWDKWYDLYVARVGKPEARKFAILFNDISERKLIERERERFLAIGSDLQVIMGTDGYFQWVSPTVERILGWTAEEMTTQPGATFLHPTDMEASQQGANQLFGGEELFDFENRYRHKDGSYRWFLWRAQPYLDNKVIYAAGIDITERKQTEAALRESEERLRIAMQNSAIVLSGLDLQLRYTWTLNTHPDFAEAKVIGKTAADIMPEENAKQLLAINRRVLERGVGSRNEIAIELSDGLHFYDHFVEPFHDTTGKLTGLTTAAIDITDRKKAEEVLSELYRQIKRQSAVFDTTLSTITDHVYNYDRDGRFLYANQTLLDLWGLKKEDAIGKTMAELNYQQEVETRLLEGIRTVFDTQQMVTNETFYTSPSGMSGHYENILTPVFSEDGTVEFVTGSSRDITQHKQLEEVLRDADRRKNEFLATLAHELRNPLTPIRAALEILNHSENREQQQQVRMIIERQIRKIVILVDDLLEISRITRGKIQLHKEIISIQAVLKDVIETTQPLITAAGHQFTLQVPEEVVCIHADDIRIAQILVNIVNNAIKYTNNGGTISLIVTTENDQVVIRIKDNGIGIPTDRLESIFEIFEQVEHHGKKFQSGLGIGLSLAKDLTELHGGTVTAHSEGEGKGSEFTVRLPLAEDQTPLDEEPPCEDDPEIPAFEGNRKRILVVEDDIDIADMMQAILELENYTVQIANNGESAIRVATEFIPEAALVDIGLPDMDGHEVARRLRKEYPSLLLIAHSGWGADEDLQRSKEAGFDHHLVKPADIEEITALLTKA